MGQRRRSILLCMISLHKSLGSDEAPPLVDSQAAPLVNREPSAGTPAAHILILHANQLCVDALQTAATVAFPGCICSTASTTRRADEICSMRPVDLLLVDIDLPSEDVIDYLHPRLSLPRRVLVILSTRRERPLQMLKRLPISGILDPMSDSPAKLPAVLRSISAGQTYWSPSVGPQTKKPERSAVKDTIGLTRTEELVLTVIGGGCDDNLASERLGLKASTIQTARRNIHRKLQVPQRGELVRVAAQLGYVRFTEGAVIHSGLATLSAGRQRAGNLD